MVSGVNVVRRGPVNGGVIFRMALKKKEIYNQCLDRVKERLDELKQSSYTKLHGQLLDSNPYEVIFLGSSQLVFGKFKYDMGPRIQKEQDQTIAVIVEARRPSILGSFHVLADGFFISSDNQITSMKESDLWEHGY